MRVFKFTLSLCVIFVAAAFAQPPKVVPKPPTGQTQVTYLKRVDIISDEIKPLMADLWATFDKMEALNTIMQKRIQRDGDATATDKENWNKLKTALGSTVQSIRGNTKRLRSISPVPRSLKKIDNELVDASLEIETGLDSLQTWANNPSPEMNLQLGRELRKGITSWTNARIKLSRATDPVVKAKVYVD